MPSHRRHNLLAHILLIGVVLVWGCTFPLVKSALNDVSPLLFNLLRMTLAAIALLVLNHRTLRGLTRAGSPSSSSSGQADFRLCVTAGLFLALGYQFQTSGLARTTPSKSAFLTGLVVVIVPILSVIPRVAPPTSPKPNTIVFLGAILAFIGLILLTSTPGTGMSLLSGMHLGEWLTLLCAVAFAAHLLTLAHAAPQLSARRLGTLQIAFAAIFMLITLPLGGRPHLHLTPTAIVALAITALFATAAAFTIQSWAQQILPPTHTALILTLEPVFAALTSLLFFHERFGPRELLGAALILAGILLAELRGSHPVAANAPA
jgi:drug/metabolite transporter (DMT)-like permease